MAINIYRWHTASKALPLCSSTFVMMTQLLGGMVVHVSPYHPA